MELSAIKLFSLQQICLNTVMYKTQTEIAAKNKKFSTFIYLIHGGLVIPCMKKIYTGFSQLQSNKKNFVCQAAIIQKFPTLSVSVIHFRFPGNIALRVLDQKTLSWLRPDYLIVFFNMLPFNPKFSPDNQ